jgi:peptidoglycan/LPS O-acetylase OafA/YrhL
MTGRTLAPFLAMGPTAVQVFFVLSGFLVSGLLFQEIQNSGTVFPARFLIRRGFKIYPAFWVMLIATVLWNLHRGGSLAPGPILGELFYLQNYDWCLSFHTWSLAVEEHFYFLLAGIFLFARWRTRPGQKVSLPWLPDLCLAVAVICLLSRAVLWYTVYPTSTNYFLFTHADYVVIDSLFFGVFVSFYWHTIWDEGARNKIIRWAAPFAILGLVLLLPMWETMGAEWFYICRFIMLNVGACLLLLSSLALDRCPCRRLIRPIARLGQYSYSVYLWHLLVGYAVFPRLAIKFTGGAGWLLNVILYFATAWIIGIVLALVIEVPVIRCRDRWFPSMIRRPLPGRPETILEHCKTAHPEGNRE